MVKLTSDGQQLITTLTQRYGVSEDAVKTLLIAVNNGRGSQAQFSHPELGGMGQWSYGGMTMVGDMFNNNLKALVSNLCTDISNALSDRQIFEPNEMRPMPSNSQSQSQGSGFGSMMSMGTNTSWPGELGSPSSSGSQNNMRYAFFPAKRRLALDVNGEITVYDTGDHQISGVSQQQGSGQSLVFTSQHGNLLCSDLPKVETGAASGEAEKPAATSDKSDPQSSEASARPAQASDPAMPDTGSQPAAKTDEIFSLIEKLADLHKKGILTEDEFNTKKTELLSRL